MRAVVDTNFIVALIVEDDVNHLNALDVWGKLEEAVLPAIAVSELAYFLLKHHVDLEVLEEVLSDPKIEVEPLKEEDLIFALRNSNKIKTYDDFNDFLILSTAVRLGLKLLTYDRVLQEIYQKHVK